MPRHSCDSCGATPALPVVYGYPGPELLEEAQRGAVILGGCLVAEGVPDWLCSRCSEDRDSEEPEDDTVAPDSSS